MLGTARPVGSRAIVPTPLPLAGGRIFPLTNRRHRGEADEHRLAARGHHRGGDTLANPAATTGDKHRSIRQRQLHCYPLRRNGNRF
jgi:hypothetical protein